MTQMIDSQFFTGGGKRTLWLDALRGFCMFLVVYMHISNFSIGLGASESVVMQVIFTCFLSTFFFISGYVSYKDSEIWTVRHTLLKLKNKFMQLMIPAVVFYVLYQICEGKDLLSWIDKGFQGYWFLIVLFEVFVVYYMVCMISQLSGSKFFVIILAVVTTVLVFAIFVLPFSVRTRNVFSIVNFTAYMPFFAIGVISKVHENLFEKILWSEYLFAFGLVVFAVVEWFICSAHSTDMYAVYGKMGYIMQMSVKYIGTYLLVSMFYRNSDLFERDSIIAKSLCFLGKRTLDVYLLHWFFIPSISVLYVYVEGGGNPILEIVFVSMIAVVVILGAIALGEVIRNSKYLGKWLLGVK